MYDNRRLYERRLKFSGPQRILRSALLYALRAQRAAQSERRMALAQLDPWQRPRGFSRRALTLAVMLNRYRLAMWHVARPDDWQQLSALRGDLHISQWQAVFALMLSLSDKIIVARGDCGTLLYLPPASPATASKAIQMT